MEKRQKKKKKLRMYILKVEHYMFETYNDEDTRQMHRLKVELLCETSLCKIGAYINYSHRQLYASVLSINGRQPSSSFHTRKQENQWHWEEMLPLSISKLATMLIVNAEAVKTKNS